MECIDQPPATADAPTSRTPSSSSVPSALIERLNARKKNDEAKNTIQQSAKGLCRPSFDAVFREAHTKVELTLDTLKKDNTTPLADQFLELERLLSTLQAVLTEYASSIPPYDQKRSQQKIDALVEEKERARNELLPRESFSFRRKRKAKTKTESESDNGQIRNIKAAAGDVAQEIQSIQESFSAKRILQLKQSEDIVIEPDKHALHVVDMRRTRVFCGPIAGSLMVERCQECVFAFAARQIRIHHCHDCDFFLSAQSSPIIEDCNKLRFAPFQFRYDDLKGDCQKSGLHIGEYEEKGVEVIDFNWVKTTPSPHWTRMENVSGNNTSETERVTVESLSCIPLPTATEE